MSDVLTPIRSLVVSLMGVLRLIDSAIAPTEQHFYRVFTRLIVARLTLRLARFRLAPQRATPKPPPTPHAPPVLDHDPEPEPERPPAIGKDVPDFLNDLARLHARIERAEQNPGRAAKPTAPKPHPKRPYQPRARHGALDSQPNWVHALTETDCVEARDALRAMLSQDLDWAAICARSGAIVRAIQDTCHMLGTPTPHWIRLPRRPRKPRPSIQAESRRIAEAIRSPWASPESVRPYRERGISGLLPGDGPPPEFTP